MFDHNTICEVLRHRSKEQPENLAYTFLENGEADDVSITYAELERKAMCIAAALEEVCAAGARVMLLYPPGLDYIAGFFGCLYAGAIAVPAYPPARAKSNRSNETLSRVVIDSGATVVITTSAIARAHESSALSAAAGSLKWLATDDLASDVAANWMPRKVDASELAFLQYTSGSTGNPKGVMVRHANMMANSALICERFCHTPDSVTVIWLPPYHDMGLIGGIIQPIFAGFHGMLMAPAAFVQRPSRWLQAISRHRATSSGGPDFAYNLCAQQITPEQCAGLDLSSWSVAFTGAEPIRSATLQAFAKKFEPYGFRSEAFYPCYGMAETTLMVTGGRVESKPISLSVDADSLKVGNVVEVQDEHKSAHAFVGCGSVLQARHSILIVDPATRQPCAPDRVGEVWVSGPSVTQGYWNNHSLTEDIFRAFLDDGVGPFLRTGDLAFVRDDELYIVGRSKDLIIVRGKNYSPHDIEDTAIGSNPALSKGSAAAFSVHADDGDLLVVLCEVHNTARGNLTALGDAVRAAVIETHGLRIDQLQFVKLRSLPKTSSGKIRRSTCRQLFLDGELQIVAAPADTDTVTHEVEPARAITGSIQTDIVAVTSEDAKARVQDWLVAAIARVRKQSPDEIGIYDEFNHFGIDSLDIIRISGELEEWLCRRVDPSWFFDYPSIEKFSKHLASLDDNIAVNQSEPTASGPSRPFPEEADELIAVVGMSCRLPGANDIASFWRALEEGHDAISEVPAARWDIDALYDAEPGKKGKTNSRWGGFLTEVDQFDAEFFRISPREAERMDPQQRLLLELAWEALEDSGVPAEKLAGSETGVFIGMSSRDYSVMQTASVDELNAYSGTGNAQSIAANRISYFFDFCGPSLTIDTACSSSLVAVHLACRSILTGDCKTALVGGVNLMLRPDLHVVFSQAKMLAADGRCKTFDDRADGYVRGEGGGVVILKRLSQARKDKDKILAVVRGSAINQDGHSNGITAPNGPAQETVIKRALEAAGVRPESVSYVETHGTGTRLGDPIEFRALENVFAVPQRVSTCRVGSVKTNIGHLEAAAGMAGFIKVILALQHGVLPAHLHFRGLNKLIVPMSSDLEVCGNKVNWEPIDGARIAGISSFGFGGTNCHIVVEEAPGQESPPDSVEFRARRLLTLSSSDEVSLKAMARCYSQYLGSVPDPLMGDICHTANAGRSHLAYRVAIQGENPQVMAEKMLQFANGRESAETPWGKAMAHPKVAFMFTGQASQYAGMGRDLYESFPVFRDAIRQCDDLLMQHWSQSLISVLYGNDPAINELIHKTAYAQPALFAFQYALTQLWISWGIRPACVLGHSLGEYAAACAAGVMKLDDALDLLVQRGRLIDERVAAGVMVVVFADEATALDLIGGGNADVSLAAINADGIVVLAGNAASIELAVALAARKGLQTQALPGTYAFHSALMDPILDDFERVAGEKVFSAPSIPMISNVTGELIGAQRLSARYWRDHLRQTVRFADGIKAAHADGCRIFLEIGPDAILTGLAKRSIPNNGDVRFIPSLRKRLVDQDAIFNAVARVYAAGAIMDWTEIDGCASRRHIALPTRIYNKQRHWFVNKHDRSESVLANMVNTEESMNIVQNNDVPKNRAFDHVQSAFSVSTDFSPVVENGYETLFSKQLNIMSQQLALIDPANRSSAAFMTRANPGGEQAASRAGASLEMRSVATVHGERIQAAVKPHFRPDIGPIVMNTVSSVSAYPVDRIRSDMRLITDMGFDSLMLVEFVGKISEHIAAASRILPKILIADAPISDIIAALSAGDVTQISPSTTSSAVHEPELTKPALAGAVSVHATTYETSIEKFPEVQGLQARFTSIKLLGVTPSYFSVNDGTSTNTTNIAGVELSNYSSYNYLGLSGDQDVAAATIQAIQKYGTSVSASRLLSGEKPLHGELEKQIADFLNCEDAIVFVGGHATNVSVIGHLLGPEDIILHDALAHDSIVRGAIQSGARKRSFPHNDMDALDRILQEVRPQARRILIAAEGVYSMDGDIVPLDRLIEIKKKHGALLLLDEAHSLGVIGATGRGAGEVFGVKRSDVDLWMGSLSKSMASCGGFIAGTAEVIRYLKYTTPGFIFSAGITPANAAAALAALKKIELEPERVVTLQARSAYFLRLCQENGIDVGMSSGTAIVPYIVGDSMECMRLKARLATRGVNVEPIVHPAVPEHLARLRFFLTALHTEEQIRSTVSVLAEEIKAMKTLAAIERDQVISVG